MTERERERYRETKRDVACVFAGRWWREVQRGDSADVQAKDAAAELVTAGAAAVAAAAAGAGFDTAAVEWIEPKDRVLRRSSLATFMCCSLLSTTPSNQNHSLSY